MIRLILTKLVRDSLGISKKRVYQHQDKTENRLTFISLNSHEGSFLGFDFLVEALSITWGTVVTVERWWMEPSLVWALNPAFLWTPWPELSWHLFPQRVALLPSQVLESLDTWTQNSPVSAWREPCWGGERLPTCGGGPAGSAAFHATSHSWVSNCTWKDK